MILTLAGLWYTLQKLSFSDKMNLIYNKTPYFYIIFYFRGKYKKWIETRKKKLQTTFNTRQYMLSKDFELYYYNDLNFTGTTSHSHNYYEFYFFIEGDVILHIGNIPFQLKSGDIVLIPPNMPHYAKIPTPNKAYRRFVFWISIDYFNQLTQLSSNYTYLMEQAADNQRYIYHHDMITINSLQGKVLRLLEEIHSDRFGKESAVSLCVNDLILHMNRAAYEQDHKHSFREEQGLYENLLQYIEYHLEEELTLDRIANHFYVSKYYIAHLFKKRLGLSIHQYITKKRLAMCRDAILSNTSISKAYVLYGFKDYSSFFRAFRKEFGLSPKEYKELHSLPKQ